MASKSIAHEAIDSETIRSQGIIVNYFAVSYMAMWLCHYVAMWLQVKIKFRLNTFNLG